jgi:hypothetical protein
MRADWQVSNSAHRAILSDLILASPLANGMGDKQARKSSVQ